MRTRVFQARSLQHPILTDTLPMFYYDIVESISEASPRRTAVDGNTLASEHGGERARLAAYDYTALIEEYQVFRWAISMAFHDGEKLRLSISPVDIGDVIQEVQADAGPRVDVRGQTVQGWWDRAALKRALENLVTNAVKYGSPTARSRSICADSEPGTSKRLHDQDRRDARIVVSTRCFQDGGTDEADI